MVPGSRAGIALFLYSLLVSVAPPLWAVYTAIVIILLKPLRTVKNLRMGAKLLWPLIAICLIGVLAADEYSTSLLRDLVYSAKPILITWASFVLALPVARKDLFKYAIFLPAIFCSCLFISYIAPFLGNDESLMTLRKTHAFNLPVVVAIAAGIYVRMMSNQFAPSRYSGSAGLLTATAVIISQSRTFIIIGILFSGYIKRLVLLFLLIIPAMYIANAIVDTQATKNTNLKNEVSNLSGKFFRVFEEIYPSDYDEPALINLNWRGYETFYGLEAFSELTSAEKIFGGGFGATAMLGKPLVIGENVLPEIPLFHNGFIFLLLKTGFAGLVLYLIFIFSSYRFFSTYAVDRKIKSVMDGLLLTILATTFVTAGLYSKTSSNTFALVYGVIWVALSSRSLGSNVAATTLKYQDAVAD